MNETEQTCRTDNHPTRPGPWADEPDKVQWVDPVTDLDCLAVRNHRGAWCGYVGLPPGHPWHGVDYGDIPESLDVHGGLTYSDTCDEDGLICHVPGPGRPADVWWLGFDCGHAGDLIPGFAELPGWPGLPFWDETYRTLEYVKGECTRLAGQLTSAQ